MDFKDEGDRQKDVFLGGGQKSRIHKQGEYLLWNNNIEEGKAAMVQ